MSGPTIALVEDNGDNRLLVETILEDAYGIRSYASGIEALDAMKKDVPALVLLDVSLPELSGEQVLERIRADERLRDVPVVAMTAHAMRGDKERFLREGFDGYVSKPIEDETVLLDTIERLLARARGEVLLSASGCSADVDS